MPRKLSNEIFIERSLKVHNNQYTYNLTKYTNNKTKVIITCKHHGNFLQNPSAHLRGSGCPKCNWGGPPRMSQQVFLEKALKLHGNRYDYSKTVYQTAHKKIIITCLIHGDFYQTPAKHLRGTGCPQCGVITTSLKNKKKIETFIEQAQKIHGNFYDYSEINYINTHTPIKIICPQHGPFFQSPTNHIDFHNQNRCPRCVVSGYSLKAIQWLKHQEQQKNIVIQHAENSKEFIIPNTRLKVDGYDHQSQTIYEFYGDAFHGNPLKYAPQDRCHPYNKNITAEQLFLKTLEREKIIQSLGYKLITIWESEWDALVQKINKK